jgi:hypothetical protein
MKLNVTIEHYLGLQERGLILEHVFLLKLIEENYDLNPLCEEHERINGVVRGMYRKGLITKDGGITIQGKELLEFMSSVKNKRFAKKKIDNSDFLVWWEEFPKNNIFTYKGKSFEGSRSMRVRRDDCRLKFESIISEGEYTAQQLIQALKTDVLMKKEESYNTGDNKLKYMQNSLTYLNQRSYENFIDVKVFEAVSDEPQETKNLF